MASLAATLAGHPVPGAARRIRRSIRRLVCARTKTTRFRTEGKAGKGQYARCAIAAARSAKARARYDREMGWAGRAERCAPGNPKLPAKYPTGRALSVFGRRTVARTGRR